MIGGLISILIALWYYKSAQSRAQPALQWAFAGAIVYYIPNFIWSLAVAKPMMNQLHAQNAGALGSLLGFSSVFVGLLCAALVFVLTLRNKKA